MRHVCTIASNNYLAFASVFARSYRRFHPGSKVFVCVVDRRDPAIDYGALPFRTIFADELGIERFAGLAFRYGLLELNTAVKPSLLMHLRERHGLDRVAYFDPDIEIHDRLPELDGALERSSMALTPHILAPLDNEYRPSERQIRMTGIFNLGFLALRLDASTRDFLDWWHARLERFCLVDPWHGLFVDQSWMDFAPVFLDDVAILREPRLNVAYWNLARRPVRRAGPGWTVAGRPLGFFHFSGIDLQELGGVSRHQNRIRIEDAPDLADLFAAYRDQVLAEGHERLRGRPYGYAAFSGGIGPIPAQVRRLYGRVDPLGLRWPDPFATEGEDSFWRWLTEPVGCYHGTLNRAVLSGWEARADLVERFPAPAHGDLLAFHRWLLEEGGLGELGLDDRFAAGLELHGPEKSEHRTYIQEPFRAYVREQRTERAGLLPGIDLTAPGERAAELLEPFPGDPHSRSPLPRLAMMLWEESGTLQRRFPDPLREDRRAFLRWYVWEGALDLGLHPDLVRPVAARLPLADRLAIAWSGFGRERRPEEGAGEGRTATRPAGDTGARIEAESVAPAAARPRIGRRGSPPLSVNVLSRFQAGGRDARLARGTLAACAAAGIPATRVDLDADPWGSSHEGLMQLDRGAPGAILIAHVGLRLAPWLLGWLPAAATLGVRRILALAWDFSSFPSSQRAWLHHFDEVWVPSRAAAAALESVADVPVREVPPCVEPLSSAPARSAGADGEREEERTVLLSHFDATDRLQRDDPWTLLESIRLLIRRGFDARRFELDLRVTGWQPQANVASEAGQLASALRAAAEGLPVRILDASTEPDEERCSAYVTLGRADGVALEPIRRLRAGIPVVGTDEGALAQWLALGGGVRVPCSPVPIGRNVGFLSGTTSWAQADPRQAATALAALLEDLEGARERAAAGAGRIRALCDPEPAGARLRQLLLDALDSAPGART